MSTREPSIVQHFGNAEVANGGFLFQGVVTGDIHIDREFVYYAFKEYKSLRCGRTSS